MTTLNRFFTSRSYDTKSILKILFILIGLVIFASIFSNGVFLQPRNFVNLILQNAGLIIVTIGQLLVIAVAGIDLSVGAVMAVSSVLVVLFQDYGLAGAFAVALGGSLLFGLVNGVLVTFIRLPAFVVTMATMQIGYSVAKLLKRCCRKPGWNCLYQSDWVPNYPPISLLFTKPLSWVFPNHFFICLAFLIIIAIYLRTSNGHFIFPVGGNEKTAFLSGIPVWIVKISAYAICAVLAGVAGILFASRVGLGDPQAGTWIALDSIAAASIGGASLSGGMGTILGTFFGVVILSVLNNIMNLLGVPPTMQPAIKGIVILLAVYLNTRRK